MFAPGEAVRVKDAWPEASGPVHIRTPYYVRGVAGVVARHLGDFPNPEDLAFARPAERRPLYHVRFRKAAIWPEQHPDDELLVEIFGHWLEPAGPEPVGLEPVGLEPVGLEPVGLVREGEQAGS